MNNVSVNAPSSYKKIFWICAKSLWISTQILFCEATFHRFPTFFYDPYFCQKYNNSSFLFSSLFFCVWLFFGLRVTFHSIHQPLDIGLDTQKTKGRRSCDWRIFLMIPHFVKWYDTVKNFNQIPKFIPHFQVFILIQLLQLFNNLDWLAWSEVVRNGFAWKLGYLIYVARVVQKLGWV